MSEWERRYFELRADVERRQLSGVVMRYGDVARIGPRREETFIPGAFGDVAALDVILNIQHTRARLIARTGGGGLELTDSPQALEVAATLPNTRESDDALEMVKRGLLRGFSIEFGALEQRNEGIRRIVQRAVLGNIGLVDRPAYGDSLVALRAEGMAPARRRFWL